MKLQKETSFRVGDGAVIAGIVCIALILLLGVLRGDPAEERKTVQILQNGQMICELPLEKEAEWTVNGPFVNRILLRDGRVRVAESSCPGEDCVHTGWIDRDGMSIFCLPNRVEIRVVGNGTEETVDAVIR